MSELPEALSSKNFVPLKKHPMWQAKTGDVFAIRASPSRWGFLRFHRGLSMAVLSVVSDTPKLHPIDWGSARVKWRFESFAPWIDETEAVFLGNIPFDSVDEEWPPPCFYPPNVIAPYYRARISGRLITEISAHEIEGMWECVTMTPAKLAAFLARQIEEGECSFVKSG